MVAAVFLVAALGKLFDPKGARHALDEFGVPASVAGLGSRVLPVAELVVAVALLIRPSARWGAAAALVLLIVFAAAVARAMSQGRAPDCHCFGQFHSEPAGRATLIRNVLLAAPTLLIVVAGNGPTLDGAFGSLGGIQAALVATSVLSGALAIAVAQLWSDKRRLERDLAGLIAAKPAAPGLPRGTRAPGFALTPVRGNAGSLSELMEPSRPAVLVFLSTGCGPCVQMLATLARWQESLATSVTVSAIFSGVGADIERLSEESGLSAVLAQDANETFTLYALRATPSAVLVDAGGLIAGAPAEGVPAIEALIRSAVAAPGPAPARIVLHSG